MADARATRELLAPEEDVWAILAEPYHLADWWPTYMGIEPDRRGLSVNARWRVVRAASPGLLRRGGADGVIVITRVEPRVELAWRDLDDGIEIAVRLAPAGEARIRATVTVRGAWWRLHLGRAARLPDVAAARLYELCQTAAAL